MKPELKLERMKGYGAYEVDGAQVNYLFGLDDMCKKYLNKDSEVLELGVNNGVSTRLFSYYSKKVTAVDFQETDELKKLISSVDNIEFHKKNFYDFAKENNNFYDLIYIDGSHLYDDVKNDISIFKEKVKCGGYLAGHDFNIMSPDVKKAVLHFFQEKDIEFFSDSSWLIKL